MPDRDHAADARRILEISNNLSAAPWQIIPKDPSSPWNLQRIVSGYDRNCPTRSRFFYCVGFIADQQFAGIDARFIAETRTLAPSLARAYLDQQDELISERRLHAATAVSLEQAEARIEELSGQVAELQKRVEKLQEGPPESGRGFCQ